VAYLFTDKAGLEGTLIDTAGGGISGAIGRYVFDKLIGARLSSMLGSLGKYADVGAAYLYGAVLNYIGQRESNSRIVSSALTVAGYVPVADYIAKLFGDPSLSGGSGVSMSNPLEPLKLSGQGLPEV
jgi:hypothetical protein